MEETSRCHRCGRDFAWSTSEDEACGLCKKPVCARCAHTWGRERDELHKVCDGCLTAHGMRREGYARGELDALRALTSLFVFSYACPVCKSRTSVRDVFQRYVYCGGCAKLVCPTCARPGVPPRCAACGAAVQRAQVERLEAERSATTTCDRCGASVQGRSVGPAVKAPGTIQCPGCSRHVCGRCLRLMKIMWGGTFPCCLECVPKLGPQRNARPLAVVRGR